MGAHEHCQDSHVPYITAVRRSIEARGIRVTDVRIGVTADGRRGATLQLRPDDTIADWQIPAVASAGWDEADGWSLTAGGGSPASRVYKGLGALPDPGDVAVWAVVLLTRPDLTPSREDHPFRDHSVPDPAFEAQLARYAPGA